MADNRGWFGQLMDRMNPATDPSRTAATTAGNMLAPGLGFAVGRLIDWNRNRNFNNAASEYNAGQQQFSDNLASGIDNMPLNGELGQFGQSLMPSAGSQDSGATVTPYSGPQQRPAQDNGWRTGEGGSGLGGGWSTLSNNAMASMLDGLGPSGTGSLAGSGDAVRFRMQPEFGVELTGPNGQQRTRGGDSRTMQHGPLMSSATAQDFIRDNPEQWAQMQRRMRERG